MTLAVVLEMTVTIWLSMVDLGREKSAGMSCASGAEVAAGGAPYADLLCLDDGTYTVTGFDSYGDGWNGTYLTVYDSEGHLALNFTLPYDDDPATPDVDESAQLSTTFSLPLTPPDANALVSFAVVLDLSLSNSVGKALQVQTLDDVPDLSWYGIGIVNNGGGTDGQEYTFPAIAVDSGEVVWIVRDATALATYAGGPLVGVVIEDPVGNHNGDDAIEVYFNGSVVDIYGDVDIDGTGEAWEYLDTWVYRTCNEDGTPRTPSATFDLTEWTLGKSTVQMALRIMQHPHVHFHFGKSVALLHTGVLILLLMDTIRKQM